MAPSRATCVTRKGACTIDYFLTSLPLAESIAEAGALDYFLRLRRPVEMHMRLNDDESVPVLAKPQRLPIDRPFGPSIESADWSHLGEIVRDGIEEARDGQLDVATLDFAYSAFVRHLETEVGLQTDTPVKQPSRRARAPQILRVPRDARIKQQWKCWRDLQQPLGWLQSLTQYLHQAVEESDQDKIDRLAHALEEPPAEYHSVQALMGLLDHAKLIFSATDVHHDVEELKSSIRRFLAQINEALDQEHQQQRRSANEAWSHWVIESLGTSPGWAHRWSQVREMWRPPRGTYEYTGKPIDTLAREANRLADTWGCTEEEQRLYRAKPSDLEALPRITAEDVRKAALTFPRRTSSTYDGIHPRHFSLLCGGAFVSSRPLRGQPRPLTWQPFSRRGFRALASSARRSQVWPRRSSSAHNTSICRCVVRRAALVVAASLSTRRGAKQSDQY